MIKKTRRALTGVLAAVLTAAMMLTATLTAYAATDVENLMKGSANYMMNAVTSPSFGQIGGEWAVIGLARSGAQVPQSYYDKYYKTVEKAVTDTKGVLSSRKYTEYSRVILALTAIGRDPSNVAGYDLLKPLGDYDATLKQGINGPVWALIALDSGKYEMPVCAGASTQATRQMYLDAILAAQLNDGGWALGNDSAASADVDVTAMALQALAGYMDRPQVQTAVNRALECLSRLQQSNGGFVSWGEESSESVSQVITALCSLGISTGDSRFVKSGGSLTDALLTYRKTDGSFSHSPAGPADQLASEQGLYCLAALYRAEHGMNRLYDMSDVKVAAGGSAAAGTTGQTPATGQTDVTGAAGSNGVAGSTDVNGQTDVKDRAAAEALRRFAPLLGEMVMVLCG